MVINQLSSELYLMILWANARYKQEEILEDLRNTHLQILECFDVAWSPEKVANNFTRFYGVKLDSGSSKEVECGTGSFLLITLLDNKPKYENAQTSHGIECVNTNIFNLKIKYREWTRGGHKIHTTNSPQETNHDITLLLGKNYEDYLKNAPQKWNGEIQKIKRNLTGCDQWESFEELFYTLNATVTYIVLRGQEFINNTSMIENSDIDIYTNEYDNLVFLINGCPGINPHRPHFHTKIGKCFYYLDVWNDKNLYYDTKWSESFFSNKTFSSNLYYELDDKNKFYELIYHSLIHKFTLKKIYFDNAFVLYHKIFSNSNELSQYKHPFDLYYQLLIKFMKTHNYRFIRPKDVSVYYNTRVISLDAKISEIKNLFHLTDIKPFMVNVFGGGGYCYYIGKKKDKKIFVKAGGISDSAQNEFGVSQILFNINHDNFLQPIDSKFSDDYKYILFEYIEGESLEDLLKRGVLTDAQKENIVIQLENIARTLINAKVVHRDIRPANLILTIEGKLILIDSQWAVYADKYEENSYVVQNIENFGLLGDVYALAQYCWDDMYSLLKIILELGKDNDFILKQIGKFKIQYNIRDEVVKLKSVIKQNNTHSSGVSFPENEYLYLIEVLKHKNNKLKKRYKKCKKLLIGLIGLILFFSLVVFFTLN